MKEASNALLFEVILTPEAPFHAFHTVPYLLCFLPPPTRLPFL